MSELKSGFDLAMERMAKRGESLAALSPEQKAAMAEIGRRAQAKRAEHELAFGPRIDAARAANDEELVKKLEDQLRVELDRVRDREARDRDAVRRGTG